MAKGAALSESSSGESTSHFSSIRIRVNGIGKLRMAVYSLDELNDMYAGSSNPNPVTILKLSAGVIRLYA